MHWPVFLVLSSDRTHLHGVPLVVVKLAVAVALALALHLLIEQPVRRRDIEPRVAVAGWLAGSAAVTVLALLLLG